MNDFRVYCIRRYLRPDDLKEIHTVVFEISTARNETVYAGRF